MIAAVVVASASAGSLPPPLFRAAGQGTALHSSGARIAAAASCDVRVVDAGSKPTLVKRFGYCREDPFESATIGLWLGKNTIVEENVLSPSPHGDSYELWVGRPRGTLHPLGGEWGWTDSGEPPTYGCDRMVAAGGGVVAITPVPNNLGDATACTGRASTQIVLKGAVDKKVTIAGAWGVLATNGKRIALGGFGSSVKRTAELAIVDLDGLRLGTPHFAADDIQRAYRGWFTPVGLFLDTKRGLVGPGSRLLVGGYSDITIGEGRAIYIRGRQLRGRRLKGGPDRLIMKLPVPDSYVAAGTYGVAVQTGTVSERNAVYRIPWSTIDQIVPRSR